MSKIISTCGFMCSGSSAVTDLLAEYEGVSAVDSFEYIFLYCPNGVFDLEDKLLNNNNGLRSDEALHSFQTAMYELYVRRNWWCGNYKKRMGINFIKCVNQYIDSLVDAEVSGHWYYTEKPSKWEDILRYVKKIIYRISLKNIIIPDKIMYGNKMLFAYPTQNEFRQKSKDFISELLKTESEYEVYDQLMLPHNLHRIDDYFENLKAIVVKRDPRDVFIENKYYWGKQPNMAVPYSMDVEQFCLQYKRSHELCMYEDNRNIKTIYFEDLCYKYEITKQNIENFLGLCEEQHIKPKSRFIPEKSIKNTRQYLKLEYDNEKIRKEVQYIEVQLSEYLYEKEK